VAELVSFAILMHTVEGLIKGFGCKMTRAIANMTTMGVVDMIEVRSLNATQMELSMFFLKLHIVCRIRET